MFNELAFTGDDDSVVKFGWPVTKLAFCEGVRTQATPQRGVGVVVAVGLGAGVGVLLLQANCRTLFWSRSATQTILLKTATAPSPKLFCRAGPTLPVPKVTSAEGLTAPEAGMELKTSTSS